MNNKMETRNENIWVSLLNTDDTSHFCKEITSLLQQMKTSRSAMHPSQNLPNLSTNSTHAPTKRDRQY
jgi:hypothetical protein